MSGTEWMVVIAGIAAIVWVNWYFFLAERGGKRATNSASAPAGQDRPAEE
jgi:hypothetical protein